MSFRHLPMADLPPEEQEKRRARSSRYYEKNKERLIPQFVAYNKKPEVKEKRSKRSKNQRRENWAKCQIPALRHRAKILGVPFDLSEKDIALPPKCPVLGFPLVIGDGRLQFNSPSVDRIYPEKGYVTGNVNVISYRANTIKLNATIEEVEAVLNYMRKVA